MTPILFAENAVQFNTNGLGRLSDAISCKVSEERNGKYELELTYPSTGIHYDEIQNRSIIAVIPYKDADLQPFRVYQISRPIGGKVVICARHISYDLAKNTAMPFTVQASATACNETLQGLKTNAVETCNFTFETDVSTNAGYSQTVPSTIRQRLGGIEGSVLDQFGGEYEWDKFVVKLHRNRGADHGVVLRYGKNITDLTQEEIIAETITGVVPYWSDMEGSEVVTLPEKAVYSQYADRYSQNLTVPLDMSGNWQSAPDEATLRAAAQAYISKYGIGIPTVSVNVSFINLADTIEYEELQSLQSVHLCDTLTVQFEKLGINTSAKVSAYKWDVLAERYDEITVGAIKSSLATAITEQNSATVASIEKTKVQAGNAINKATAWLSSGDGYIVAIKGDNGEWKELLAMDTPDVETAVKVMRLNENGLGGSSSGIDGPYEAAILVDGTIVANAIKTGILTDLNDKFYLNMETGELVMKDGIFTGLITGSTVRFGDDENYATMSWKRMEDTPLEIYQLVIEANTGRPVAIQSEKNGHRSSIEASAGSAIIFGKDAVSIGSNGTISMSDTNVYGDLAITLGDITVNGYHVPYSFTSGVNFSTFESNGLKYLGVYHGGTLYGYVQLTS